MNYKDFDVKISYKSVGENKLSSIINPLLSCTKVYRRSVGFFSSSALDFIGEGIISLARNDGRIYLCTCPRLNENDIAAIKLGYEIREILRERFEQEVTDALDLLSDNNAQMLYSLVKEGILDIKVVCKNGGIYHDKLAVLEDFSGNQIAFVGSANESAPGYHDNYEKVRVYKSWTDIEGRVKDETEEFLSIWDNANEFLTVYNFMDAFKRRILERVENGPSKKGNNSDSPYEMRDYQKQAKKNWVENGHKGFYVMATGTGKTITSLYSIQELIRDNKVFTIIAVPYKHLVTQWYEDVKNFFPDADVHFVHSEAKDPEGRIYASYLLAKHEYKPIIIITTIKSFFIDRFKLLYDKVEFDKLLIVDEAHNFVNRIDEELFEKYIYKLGLSATPVFGNDAKKTQMLIDWFGGKVMDFPIEKAIGKYLVNYEYHPIFIEASEVDEEKFAKATTLMMSAIDQVSNIIIDEEKFMLGYRGRLRAISMAEGKIKFIKSIFSKIEDKDHFIIYCSDGKLFFDDKENGSKKEIRHLEFMLKMINNSLLEENMNLRATKFTATEDINTRMELIDRFNKEYDQIMVAIKCLDEGINIPSIKSALILSSNDNYREFVQRRGRILRLYSGKDLAHIYDVLVMSSYSNKALAEIELRRFYEYARLAINFDQLKLVLEGKLSDYGLNYDDIKFKNDFVYGGDLDD